MYCSGQVAGELGHDTFGFKKEAVIWEQGIRDIYPVSDSG